MSRFLLPILLLAVTLLPGLSRADSGAETLRIEEVTSPGGISAWLVQDDSLPLVAINFAFDGGMALDPDGKAGLANLTTAMLTEGAGDLDATAFQRELADRSISLSFNAGRDAVYGALKYITDREEDAVRLTELALTEPRFDEEALDRVKRQIVTGIRAQSANPRWVAARALNRVLFDGHPYGEPGQGTEDSVAAIERTDLDSFLAQQLSRGTLQIAVAGDIDAARLGTVLDRLFGALPEASDSAVVADIEPPEEGRVALLPFPGPQTQIQAAQPGIRRDDPDYYALRLVNYILGGGGFSSRLMTELREKRGLTYGIYSNLYETDHTALITLGASTNNDQAAEAIALIRAEWRRMAEEGPSAEELAAAKTYLTGAFALQLTSTDAIAGMALEIQREGLGRDYPQRRDALFNDVTLDQARNAAARLLREDALTFILVGEPDGVEPDRALRREEL